MDSIAEKIIKELARHEADWCFSPKDFLELAGRDALDKAFSRLTAEGKIRRIGRGLYDVPRTSELLKTTLGPNLNQIAKAIARKHGWRIQPTGAHAANMLNLSTQVPVQAVYLSDGPTKEMQFENRTITFKKTSPKKLAAGELGGLLINALKELGKDRVTPELIAKLRKRFNDRQKEELLSDARLGPDWIFEVIRTICSEEPSDG
jgi:hypothetical protein